MASVTETTVDTTNLDDHIRSPFQLSTKSKDKSVKLVSLPQNLATQNNYESGSSSRDLLSSVSSTDSLEAASPRTSSFGASPFSLNIKKVSKSSVGSTTPLSPILSPSSLSSATTLTNSQDKIVEIQKEVNSLKKEIEAKDAKLSSSLKSIKQFWSPELKKERAARKEETEKCLILKEKYQIANSQIEEYKNALEDLESEFKSQQKNIQDLNEKVKNNHEETTKDHQDQLEKLRTEVRTKEDEIFVLTKTLEDLENEYNSQEDQLKEKNKCLAELEHILTDYEQKLEDYDHCKRDLEKAVNAVQEQEIDYQMLKKEYDEMKSVHSESQANEEEVQRLQIKIDELERDLTDQTKLVDASDEELKRLEKVNEEKEERIQKLEEELNKNEKEYDDVKEQLSTLQTALEEIETENKTLQDKIQEGTISSDSLEQKDREIRNLNTKYEKLDKYLTERENALELCRDELKGVKNANRDLRMEKDNLENQLFEQKSTVDRLEKQKDRFTRPKEDVALVSAHNELKAKHEETTKEIQELTEKLSQYDDTMKTKDNSISALESSQSEQKEIISGLEKQLEESNAKTEQNQKNIEELEKEKTTLNDELTKLKQQDVTLKKPVEDIAASALSKNGKQGKKMWDEMAKKDERIEELERQLKEKTKQLGLLKKNQTVEREKQHQLVNESKKVEQEIQQLEDEKDRRDKRIIMLEDALRESVTIAVEREDLLASHKEMYENAVNKMNSTNSEYERVELEKKITNIKNAFLILSLSEKDALIASMEATRKRQNEELFNIKQETLLASISEKDNQIAHLELQSSKTKKQDIKQLKLEKEKFVEQLKAQNNNRMTILSNSENENNLLINELESAPPEQVYEAIRHLHNSTSKLEFYIEEFLSYSNEQYKKVLDDLPTIPKTKCKSTDSLKKLSKPELLKELKVVDVDCNQLKGFVHSLLDKLEGVA